MLNTEHLFDINLEALVKLVDFGFSFSNNLIDTYKIKGFLEDSGIEKRLVNLGYNKSLDNIFQCFKIL